MEEEDRYTRITLRIPKDLHTKLQAASDDSSKSMNAEIIERVEKSFSGTDPNEALQSIIRLERDKTQLEIDSELILQRLYVLSLVFLSLEKHLGPIAKNLPSKDLMELLANGKEISEQAVNEHVENPLQRINKKIERLNELGTQLHSVSRSTLIKNDMPRPDAVFESAVLSGDSDDPVVIEERNRRGLDNALEEASEKGAEKAIGKLLQALNSVPAADFEGQESYLDYAMRVIVGRAHPGVDALSPSNQSRTPKIPGVNAPKRGSKRTDLPKK